VRERGELREWLVFFLTGVADWPNIREVVDAVTTFADPLTRPTDDLRWHAAERRWMAVT
jgi:hypothetical protein